jgi:nicotinamidase/pyrazinamidase
VTDLGGVVQVLWPDHCVQNTPGASFHSALDVVPIAHVVQKGIDPLVDSYSAFFDNGHRRDTELASFLRERGVNEIAIAGLATDYCVRHTALDARDLGLGVTVVEDACRAANLSPVDGARALAELIEAGCSVVRSSDLLS